MKKIYESWLKRTNHINGNCGYCNNQRYTLSSSIITDRTDDLRSTLYACPACNFDDLQITKKVGYIPLHKFVMIKKGFSNINDL